MKSLKMRLISITESLSGFVSILGSWQVCHSVCLGVIFLLSIIGITVTGMPLLFLTKLALPLWIIAFTLLMVTFLLYFKKRCFSNNLLLFNSGIIIAGIPFQQFQKFTPFFWTIGGALSLTGIILFIKDRINKKVCKHETKPKSNN